MQLSPEQAKDESYIRERLSAELQKQSDLFQYRWHKRSIDARNRNIKINASFEIYELDEKMPDSADYYTGQNVQDQEAIHIIGFGPAGIYAALRAIELGYKPIVYERGKDVRARRRDLAKINKEGIVDSNSNYCFGEGGAGTYSDGKLYTRSKKRGDITKALQWFVHFGAEHDILVDAHPHIGTNKLPTIIVNMRERIIACGGEVHFESKLTDIYIEDKALKSIVINEQQVVPCTNLVLATGHSARDIFELLHRRGVKVTAKTFALGVRIEHPQSMIDEIQYHGRLNDEFLPPASYSLVTQVQGKGVYSFCMCPGGIIAPCATDQEEVVTNGWSPSKRNNPYSNSGIVTTVEPEDFKGHENDPFVCLNFQKEVEHTCWEAAGKTQQVPAQRMIDFVEGKISKDFPPSSYQPGLKSMDLNKVLPAFIAKRLRQAFVDFGKKMPGYYTNEAVLHAPESRTSSPIQIPRQRDSYEHIEIQGIFPCAEGAGYAGGIISAGIDGIKCVDSIVEKLANK